MKVLRKASRGRISTETIENLLERAKESIGTRQGVDVLNEQFRLIADYLDFTEGQIGSINESIRDRMSELDSPVVSLGIGPEMAATILAESGDIACFPGPGEYSAFCGLDPSVRESGDTVRGKSHISKRGSPLLRWALYVSAQTVVKKLGILHGFMKGM